MSATSDVEVAVDKMFATGTYDLEISLTLLRDYQFHPDRYNLRKMGSILLYSLPYAASGDFLACLYLIPEKYHDTSELRPIMECQDLLERGEFIGFWKAFENFKTQSESGKAMIDALPHLETHLKTSIFAVFNATYHSVPAAQFFEALKVSSLTEAKKVATPNSAMLEQGNDIVFDKNVFNTPSTVASQTMPTPKQLAKILQN